MTSRTGQAVSRIPPGAREHPLRVVSWASQREEGGRSYHICHWVEGGAYRIGHSLGTPEVDMDENMQPGPQSRSSQSETRSGEVAEAHAFCNRPYRLCEPGAEDNRDSLEGGKQVF